MKMEIITAQGPNLFEAGSSILSAIQRDHAMNRQAELAGKSRWDAYQAGVKRHFDTAMEEMKSGRRDAPSSFNPNSGMHLQRELEYQTGEVFREVYPLLNSFTLFGEDGSTPPGATTVKAARIHQHGEAKFHGLTGTDVPMVGNTKQEQTWPVRYMAAGFRYSAFERMADNFANSNMIAENLRTCRDIIQRFANEVNWFGNVAANIHGIIDYPYLPQKTVATAFQDASSSNDIMSELTRFVNFPSNNSGARFAPNRLVMSPRLRNYLFARDRNATSASDKSIGEVFLSRQRFIKEIDEAQELQGSAPGGLDYMLAYRDDRMGIERRPVGGMFNVLPPQEKGFDTVVYCWAGTGGIRMLEPGHNILGIVTPPAD